MGADLLILGFFIEHRAAWLTPVIIIFTQLSGPTLMLLYSVVLSFLYRTAYPAVAVALANLISHVAKGLFGRPRPSSEFHLVVETNPAFPSGHAVGAAAFAMALILVLQCGWRWWFLLIWLCAIAVGLSRLYVGVHWPSDLIAGWVLGAGVSWIVFMLAPQRPD